MIYDTVLVPVLRRGGFHCIDEDVGITCDGMCRVLSFRGFAVEPHEEIDCAHWCLTCLSNVATANSTPEQCDLLRVGFLCQHNPVRGRVVRCSSCCR